MNVNKVRAKLRIRYRAPFQPKDRESNIYIDDSLKLGGKSTWTMTNTNDRPIEVAFIIQKF